jgi:hypothetical protein
MVFMLFAHVHVELRSGDADLHSDQFAFAEWSFRQLVLAPAQVISSGRTPHRAPPVCLVRGLKGGRKGHMKTITVIEK